MKSLGSEQANFLGSFVPVDSTVVGVNYKNSFTWPHYSILIFALALPNLAIKLHCNFLLKDYRTDILLSFENRWDMKMKMSVTPAQIL